MLGMKLEMMSKAGISSFRCLYIYISEIHNIFIYLVYMNHNIHIYIYISLNIVYKYKLLEVCTAFMDFSGLLLRSSKQLTLTILDC